MITWPAFDEPYVSVVGAADHLFGGQNAEQLRVEGPLIEQEVEAP